jgi:hypothetical protein
MRTIAFESWYIWDRSFYVSTVWCHCNRREWLDKNIEARKKGNVNKVIECGSFLKREDGKELRGADNMMMERIPCEVYKKGAVFELRERMKEI